MGITVSNHPMKLLSILIASASYWLATPSSAADQPAPDFHGKNLSGQEVSLATFKGKVVVLEWVNFDCPFVKKHYSSGNLPQQQRLATAKGVVWITINSSAPSKSGHLEATAMAERAAKEGNQATHILLDPQGTIGKAFGAKVTPHLFIIDADGKLRYDGAIDSKPSTDPADLTTAEPWFAQALDAVLSGKTVASPQTKPYGCGVKY